MNDQRPTRWPCSADSSRNAGPEPRSFRNAETGVSVSSMKVSHTGTRLLWVVSATPGKEDLLGVAVVAQRLDRLGVARGRALAPQLAARAAPEVQLAGLARALHGLAVHVRQREHLTGAPVLNHAGHEPAVVVRDVHGTPDIRPRRAARLVGPCRDRPTALVREAGPRGCANSLHLWRS